MGDSPPYHVCHHFFRFGHRHRATPRRSFFRPDGVHENDRHEDFMKSLALYYDLSKAHALQHSPALMMMTSIFVIFIGVYVVGGLHRLERYRITQAQILA